MQTADEAKNLVKSGLASMWIGGKDGQWKLCADEHETCSCKVSIVLSLSLASLAPLPGYHRVWEEIRCGISWGPDQCKGPSIIRRRQSKPSQE